MASLPLHWWTLTAGFALRSMDGTAQIHETSIVPLREWWQTRGMVDYHRGRMVVRGGLATLEDCLGKSGVVLFI